MKIKEICTIYNGGTPSTLEKSYWDGEIKWITPKDLSLQKSRYIYQGERNISELGLKNSSAKLLPINTVLLTSRAPICYLSISKYEFATNQVLKSLFCV